jgi:predicted ester cyclase
MNVGVGPQSGVLERRFREMQSGEFAAVSDVSHRLQWVVCSGLKLPAR